MAVTQVGGTIMAPPAMSNAGFCNRAQCATFHMPTSTALITHPKDYTHEQNLACLCFGRQQC